jgi:predicted nucleotidyltransferase
LKKENKVIYKVKSGSHLYGTNTESSDVDYTSIFIPNSYYLLSLQQCDFIDRSSKGAKEYRRNTNQDFDDQSHSISRYLNLVLRGNPNLTEIIYAPNQIIELESEIFTELKNNVKKLISKKVYDSFVGFATSQRKKLEYKRIRYGELREALFLFETVYANQLVIPNNKMSNEIALRLNTILKHYKGSKNNIEHFHVGLPLQMIYGKIKSEFENYGWRLYTKEFTQMGFDVKFASHTIRLLSEGEHLLKYGRLDFPIPDQAYDDIMNIKNCKIGIEEFQSMCVQYENKCREALINTSLPNKPDYQWANDWLVRILKDSIIKEIRQ